jgi:hypothetical protein
MTLILAIYDREVTNKCFKMPEGTNLGFEDQALPTIGQAANFRV